eukprot:gene10593-12258_t
MAPGKMKALVTGGSGFLGKHLVQQMLESGKYEVVVFDIRESDVTGVTSVVGDLRKADQANGVGKLVYTSTASAVFDGTPLHMVDETRHYAPKPMDYYTQTKIEGEQLILQANGSGGVAACALRPSGIFGEGDLLFVPTIVKQAVAGKMKYIIGDGKNMMDFTYVGNVAQAHLEAADALSLTSKVAGQAYFITNCDPRPFWGMLGDMCEGLGYGRPSIKLPFFLIFFVAFLFEYVIKPVLKPFKDLKTDFTMNRILIASTNRTFSSSKAQADFGYKPKVGMEEALKKTY